MTATLAGGSSTRTAEGRRVRKLSHRRPSHWIVLTALALLGFVTILPVLLAAWNSMKTTQEYVTDGPLAPPQQFSLDNVVSFWTDVDFTGKLINSVLISLGVAILGVVLSLLAAYALGIGRIRGRVVLLVIFMIGFTFPHEALAYPIYVMSKESGLYDNILSVIITFGVLQSAFGTYLLASVMSTFPRALLEAARIDGAGRFRILTQIVIPLTRPTLMVLFTFFFIWTWNEFFLPLILLPTNESQTVSVALGSLFGQYSNNPITIAAASVVGIIPSVIFFLIFQRTLTRGIAVGAVK